MKPSLYIAFISVLICFSCEKHVGNDPDAICVTAEATAVKETSAYLHGYANLTSDMTGPVELGFLVSLDNSPSLENSERISTKELNPDHSFQIKVKYLTPGTDFYYRAYVLRNEVYMYGDVKRFKTKDISASVITVEADKITANNATLHGSYSINSEDDFVIKKGFYIGKNGDSVEDLRNSGKRVDSYDSSQRFSAKVSNLTENSDYYFVAFIDIYGKVFFGSIISMHTLISNISNGFYTLEHEGFKFKIREGEYNTPEAQSAIALLKENFEEINSLLPQKALDVMHRNPVWMERNLTDGAAWYHSSKDYLVSQGYMVEKWHCVELCNYVHYVSWAKQNQPYMVLHELCHLYHDLALPGGFENPDVKAAYNHAMAAGLYVNTAYRLDKNTVIDHYDDYYHAKVYATTNQMEYFSEICEAYWGENDYFPFNYEDLKAYDPQGFALMEKVWGERRFD